MVQEECAIVTQHINTLRDSLPDINLASLIAATDVIVECLDSGGKILICGNGGSAADAQHMAAEFMNILRPSFERPPIPAIALTTDTSFLTSHANDYGFESVFSRQIGGLGNPGDVMIAITTSGNSKNIQEAIRFSKVAGVTSIVLTSAMGMKGTAKADHHVIIPGKTTQIIQECMLMVEHLICELVEEKMYGFLEDVR